MSRGVAERKQANREEGRKEGRKKEGRKEGRKIIEKKKKTG